MEGGFPEFSHVLIRGDGSVELAFEFFTLKRLEIE
jgi:hypothetical protein